MQISVSDPISEYMGEKTLDEKFAALEEEVSAWAQQMALRIVSRKFYLFASLSEDIENGATMLYHDTYVQAKENFPQFNPAHGPFQYWLFGIMKRVVGLRAREYFARKPWKQVALSTLPSCDEAPEDDQTEDDVIDSLDQYLSTYPDIDQQLILREQVKECFSQLTDRERLIANLSSLGLQGPEIARQVHVSPDYLRAMRQRSSRRLRKHDAGEEAS